VHQLVAADLVDGQPIEALELVEYGAHGHGHVVPGVAVRDREDVEVVDLAATALELGVAGRHRALEANDAGIGHGGFLHRRGEAVASPWRRDEPQTAFRTLSALRQRVQTYSRRGAPSTRIRTFWRFGLKRRLVATIEWLRLFPNAGPFPHE